MYNEKKGKNSTCRDLVSVKVYTCKSKQHPITTKKWNTFISTTNARVYIAYVAFTSYYKTVGFSAECQF